MDQGPRSIRTGLAVVNVHTVGDTVVHEIAAEACGTGDGGMWLQGIVGETVGACADVLQETPSASASSATSVKSSVYGGHMTIAT